MNGNVTCTEHDAVTPVPATSVHDPAGVKATVPVGTVAPVTEESITVAVQFDDWPTKTLVGLHVMVVVVL